MKMKFIYHVLIFPLILNSLEKPLDQYDVLLNLPVAQFKEKILREKLEYIGEKSVSRGTKLTDLFERALARKQFEHLKQIVELAKNDENERRWVYFRLRISRNLTAARIVYDVFNTTPADFSKYITQTDECDDSFAFFTYHANRSQNELFRAILFADYDKIDQIFKQSPRLKNEPIKTIHAAYCTPMSWAKGLNDKEVINFLRNRGAFEEEPSIQARLSRHLREKDYAGVRNDIEINNADINAADIKGMAPIHWAAVEGNADLIITLIAVGARVNIVDRDKGRTPIAWCLRMHEDSVYKGGRQIITSELLPCLFILIGLGGSFFISDLCGKTSSYRLLFSHLSKEEQDLIEDIVTIASKKNKSTEDKKALLLRIFFYQKRELETLKRKPRQNAERIARIEKALIADKKPGSDRYELKDNYATLLELMTTA